MLQWVLGPISSLQLCLWIDAGFDLESPVTGKQCCPRSGQNIALLLLLLSPHLAGPQVQSSQTTLETFLVCSELSVMRRSAVGSTERATRNTAKRFLTGWFRGYSNNWIPKILKMSLLYLKLYQFYTNNNIPIINGKFAFFGQNL